MDLIPKKHKKLSQQKSFFMHHIIKIYWTKLGFGHVETFFRSFWTISIDMKKPYEFEVWVQKCVFKTKIEKYLICGLNQEISVWKLFFFEKFRSSATFFIFIICAQNGYLWSYEPLKPHVKSSFFTRITFENIASGFTEKTVIRFLQSSRIRSKSGFCADSINIF